MTAWAHLPNAALVDQVLASVRANPGEWDAAWLAARGVAQDTAWDAAWDAARGAARDAAWNEAWGAAWAAAQGAAWNAAWGAVAALIAYDDADQFMKLPVEHLQRLYRIEPHPMFRLLQPAAIVFSPRAMS